MNPRQRRGVLLIVLAVIGAVAVFVSISNYVTEVRALVGQDRAILQLASDASRFEPVSEGMLQSVEMPEKFVPRGALSLDEILTQVAAADMPAGTILQQGMMVPAPSLQADETEIAITVDAETGVGGNIRPGDYVDVYATFGASEGRPACEARLITDVLIMGVGLPSVAERPGEEGVPEVQEVVPVRFALDPTETEQLVLAESFANEVRLALVGPARLVRIQGGESPTLAPQPCRVPPGVFIATEEEEEGT